jgi:hypothetical protein
VLLNKECYMYISPVTGAGIDASVWPILYAGKTVSMCLNVGTYRSISYSQQGR